MKAKLEGSGGRRLYSPAQRPLVDAGMGVQGSPPPLPLPRRVRRAARRLRGPAPTRVARVRVRVRVRWWLRVRVRWRLRVGVALAKFQLGAGADGHGRLGAEDAVRLIEQLPFRGLAFGEARQMARSTRAAP